MERLAVIDLFSNYMFIVITFALWIGVMLARNRMAEFPRIKCNFGNWVVFGHTIDLETSNWVYVGMTLATIWVAWYFVSVVVNTRCRRLMLRKVETSSNTPHRPTGFRMLRPPADVRITGDFLSAWIWQQCTLMIGDGVDVCGIHIGLRNITFLWRFGAWIYLVAETEQLIALNNLTDENTWTYGQISSLFLIIVPSGVLWDICYRKVGWFKNYFDSFHGYNLLSYGFGGIISTIIWTTTIGLVGRNMFGYLLGAAIILYFFIPEYLWCYYSRRFDQLLGNDLYPPQSKYWTRVLYQHEMKVCRPSQTPVLELEEVRREETPHDSDTRNPNEDTEQEIVRAEGIAQHISPAFLEVPSVSDEASTDASSG
jgi:hypothetical protein